MRRARRPRIAAWLLLTALTALAAAAAGRPAGGRDDPRSSLPGNPSEVAPIPRRPEALSFPAPLFEAPAREGRRVELAEGAVAYFEVDPTLPLVEVTAATLVGSYLDPADKPGLALLTGTMLRRGGTLELAPAELDRAVDRLGAELDVRFGQIRGGASLDATAWTLDESLDLLFGVLARPRFDGERFETARSDLAEAMRRRNDDPLDVLEREWTWLLFGTEHPSTRAPTPAAAATISRDDLIDFHRRHLRPARMVFAVSGAFDPEAMTAALDRRLTAWAGAGAVAGDAGSDRHPPPASTHAPRPGLWLAEAGVPQAKVLLGHRTAAGARWTVAEHAVVDVMSEILGGGGAVSRVVGRLRTAEGLVYRAAAGFDAEPPWPAGLRVFFETRPESVPRAIELAREEIERLRREPPHPAELEVVRQTLIGRLRAAFDTAAGVAGYLALDELLGRRTDYWRQRLAALRAVTPEAVRRAAERHLRPRDLVVLVVGPSAELLSGDRRRRLEGAAGAPLVRLPARDPLTLRPRAPAPRGGSPQAPSQSVP